MLKWVRRATRRTLLVFILQTERLAQSAPRSMFLEELRTLNVARCHTKIIRRETWLNRLWISSQSRRGAG